MDVAHLAGDLQAPPEVLVGFLPQPPVRAHHAEVVMGDARPFWSAEASNPSSDRW